MEKAKINLEAVVWTHDGMWTPDTAYNGSTEEAHVWPPRLRPEDIYSMKVAPKASRCGLVPDFCRAVAAEAKWVPMSEFPSLTAEAELSVLSGSVCPLCNSADGGHHWVTYRGEDTAVQIQQRVRCPCGWVLKFRQRWANAMKAHSRFADVRLSTVSPESTLAVSMERQAEILDRVKSAPGHSYFFAGRSNTGKTHLSFALYRRALENWCKRSWASHDSTQAVWRMSAAQMLDEHVAASHRRDGDGAAEPSITLRKIQLATRCGFRPALFIDELDKIAPTEFKLGKLIELLDGVYNAEGQIVATSNKGAEYLMDKWGEDEASTVLRRIGGGRDAHAIMFSE